MADSTTKAASCSICNRNAPSHRPPSEQGTASRVKSHNTPEYSKRLEQSFVNVPYSPPTATHPAIDSNRKGWHGSEMHEATKNMERMLTATVQIMSIDDGNLDMSEKFYCKSCLDRMGQALDEQSSIIMNECQAYDEAATKEEERVESIKGALSKLANNINVDSSVSEDHAVEWALDQFNLEIQALTQACKEQEDEIRMLQNAMEEQEERSKALDSQEQNTFHELNSLERDALNFTEESRHISSMCSSVFTEIESLSKVKLMSIPFDIDVSQSGSYPRINHLRLAYRTNDKANLHCGEINAAWVQAAQLVSFTCGLYPNFNSSVVRIIPLSYPCAKIQILTVPSDGDSKSKQVYNLGWDGQAVEDKINHMPAPSLLAFLSLLSDLVAYIRSESNYEGPPFEMTECSIDGADVTKFLDSDPAWSSVVYCMACNLRWLSRLPVKMPCIL